MPASTFARTAFVDLLATAPPAVLDFGETAAIMSRVLQMLHPTRSENIIFKFHRVGPISRTARGCKLQDCHQATTRFTLRSELPYPERSPVARSMQHDIDRDSQRKQWRHGGTYDNVDVQILGAL